MDRVEPDEVQELLVNGAAGLPRLWLQPHNWWSEALHGVQAGCAQADDGSSRCPTGFPAAISTAASFNATLFRAVGSVIGAEARALANEGVTNGFTFWSPNLNILRDPRWGRGQETPGEDPLLNGKYGENFVLGFEHPDGSSGDAIAASACPKHFFAYNLENCFKVKDNCRHTFDMANLSQGELEATYLPPFEQAVASGRASGLMCSYNAVNGTPSCANAWGIETLARGKWGFGGYVTSDCHAVVAVELPFPTSHTWDPQRSGHGFDLKGASLASLGVDLNCNLGGGSVVRANATAVSPDAKQALTHLFDVLFRLGVFDPTSDDVFSSVLHP